ncbi:MAG: triose-phosphate isomerase [Deltaproteobacteria bacterium]|nr:triose-phosphate isomerase [Deltaproteobacteria bacterium]
MRTPLVAGNWKMHKTVTEAVALAEAVAAGVRDLAGVEVAVAPPFTALAPVARVLTNTPVRLGAQNVHWELEGAYTGEVAAPMLAELGVHYVIVGHSERRRDFGETDDLVARKAGRVLGAGMAPIVCVGETLEQRDAGRAFEVVETQIRAGVGPLGPDALERLVVAYEPVWAIGTGRSATAEQAQEMHAHIRATLEAIGGGDAARRVRILYGGSVKPNNAAELLGQPDVDGALVGGASLQAEAFASIARSAL